MAKLKEEHYYKPNMGALRGELVRVLLKPFLMPTDRITVS